VIVNNVEIFAGDTGESYWQDWQGNSCTSNIYTVCTCAAPLAAHAQGRWPDHHMGPLATSGAHLARPNSALRRGQAAVVALSRSLAIEEAKTASP